MKAARPFFVADSFGKTFGRTEVLKAASAWAARGTVTVLFGRNGSGKSTLIRASLGLIRADYGLVQYDGEGYLKPKLSGLARKGLMYLPDRPLLSRRKTLRWHHALLAMQLERDPPMEVLRYLNVEALLDHTESDMSGGEKRRADLSLVLARKPRCLIADEPLAGITPSDREMISAALRRLAAEGCAVLVTGHDVTDLMKLSDDVIWMVGGTTHWLGSPASARDHFQFRREYLGPRGYSE